MASCMDSEPGQVSSWKQTTAKYTNPMAGKLYIAPEDLKDRYKESRYGENRMEAYLKSLEETRRASISLTIKENKTALITISGSDSIKEVKQDVQGELCSYEAAKKYEQPPKYLPSEYIKDVAVTKEARMEMKNEDQIKLQAAKPSICLTIEALEKHDVKSGSGPCQLRQFACPECMRPWWRTVLKSKPVSRCRGRNCGVRYDALPREEEFGIGRFICPNTRCHRKFFGYCEAIDLLECRKCGSLAKPYIHPKWRKRPKKSLNPRAKPFDPKSYSRGSYRTKQDRTKQEDLGPKFEALSIAPPPSSASMYGPFSKIPERQDLHPDYNLSQSSTSSYADSSTSNQPKQPKIRPRRRRKIFNPSRAHKSEGDTMSTFLSQVDHETDGVEVNLDYDSDDDEAKVRACRFECDCGNEYTVKCRMVDFAPCYECSENNRPMGWAPPEDMQTKSNAKHSCSLCMGKRDCPNLR